MDGPQAHKYKFESLSYVSQRLVNNSSTDLKAFDTKTLSKMLTQSCGIVLVFTWTTLWAKRFSLNILFRSLRVLGSENDFFSHFQWINGFLANAALEDVMVAYSQLVAPMAIIYSTMGRARFFRTTSLPVYSRQQANY